jgi:hypothetical protein
MLLIKLNVIHMLSLVEMEMAAKLRQIPTLMAQNPSRIKGGAQGKYPPHATYLFIFPSASGIVKMLVAYPVD